MKIEIEKPVIPQFVADWLETMYLRKGDKYPVLGLVFGRGSVIDEPVYNWVVDNKDTFILAVVHGYEIEHPLYYAKIKGWELTKGESVFWNYRLPIADPMPPRLYTSGKEDGFFVKNKMTIEEWNEVGINNTNADFEVVE